MRTVKQERVDGPIGAKRNEVHKVQRGLGGKGEARRWLATRAWMLVGSSGGEWKVACAFPLSLCPTADRLGMSTTVWPIYRGNARDAHFA